MSVKFRSLIFLRYYIFLVATKFTLLVHELDFFSGEGVAKWPGKAVRYITYKKLVKRQREQERGGARGATFSTLKTEFFFFLKKD